jgi:YHS domain-containing protein
VRRGARDPVCGMKVDRSRALTLQSGARTLYFCSEGCRQAYEGRGAGEAVSSVRTR